MKRLLKSLWPIPLFWIVPSLGAVVLLRYLGGDPNAFILFEMAYKFAGWSIYPPEGISRIWNVLSFLAILIILVTPIYMVIKIYKEEK